jgi:hypothetical protein
VVEVVGKNIQRNIGENLDQLGFAHTRLAQVLQRGCIVGEERAIPDYVDDEFQDDGGLRIGRLTDEVPRRFRARLRQHG